MTRSRGWPGAALLAAFLGVVSGGSAAVFPAPVLAQTDAFRQALATAAAEDSLIAEFYRLRDYAPLWTTAGDAPQREAFFAALDNAGAHGLPAVRYDAEGLRDGFSRLATEGQRGRLEFAMTRAFLAYAEDVRSGVIADPAAVDPGIVREITRREPLAMLRGFVISDPEAYLRDLPPKDPRYIGLMRAKADLDETIRAGGWGAPVRAAELAPGDSGPEVVELRNRLVAMGYLAPTPTMTYDGAIQKAVQLFQIEHGLNADGIATEGTIGEVNRPPEARLASVIVAMERLRWMNGLTLGQRHIWVNLPDFTAKIVDDGKVTFVTKTVIGMNQADRRSPEFSDEMEHMVINPTWNVPRSITVKEYLPMLQKDPMAAGHLRIVDRSGRTVDRAAVDFTQFTQANFPFSMSQPPSDGNALGLVKFMFPNRHNIYLHDTPTKSLFKKEVRAYSHGCIRLGSPFDFAYALLARQTNDPVGLFQTNLENRSEHLLPLAENVPVHLVYFTAWPSPKGRIEYRRDIYGRDARIFEALEAAGVVIPSVQG
ncbi:MAG: murein L,D-transpeptidase [Paracoccaceae bacterium]